MTLLPSIELLFKGGNCVHIVPIKSYSPFYQVEIEVKFALKVYIAFSCFELPY